MIVADHISTGGFVADAHDVCEGETEDYRWAEWAIKISLFDTDGT